MLILLSFAFAAWGPEDFTMTLPMTPESAEGQQMLAERAVQICRGRFPQLGQYRFSGQEIVPRAGRRTATFEVHQELTCLDQAPNPTVATPAAADWQPTQEDQRAVAALTEHYFALVDAGDAGAIHRLWVDSEQAAMPLAERAAALADFRRRAGTPGRHRIAALTWYVNPPDAPRPGIYAAVDFERSYSGFELNCGYVVWLREQDGSYRLVREETNNLARQDPPLSPDRLIEARSLMHCRGG